MRKAGPVALVVIFVVVGLIAWSRAGGGGGNGVVRVVLVPAKQHVLSALRLTQAAGSYDMAFTESQTPSGMTITGHGTTDVSPLAVVAVSDVPGVGRVTARMNSTLIWEYGGADYGLSPGSSVSGPGASISGFSGLVEGTLGPREGAVSMLGLGSATGYLQLTSQEVTSADQVGTGTVDGQPVTLYRIGVDINQLPLLTGLSAEQVKTVDDAIQVLTRQGYAGTTDTLAVDGQGRILQSTSVTRFADGGAVTQQTTFSNFGGPGRVLMPTR